MPIYEYECSNCSHQLEAMQKFSDPALTNCPQCNKETLKKLVSSTSFQLKGTGWYATDFKDKGKPKAAEAKSDATSQSSDTAKSDKVSGSDTTTSGE